MYDKLLDQWDLPRPRRLVRAAKGFSNETWSVACASSEFFLRLYTDPRVGRIRFEHAVLGELAAGGLPFRVPEVVPTIAGDTVAFTNGGSSRVSQLLTRQRTATGGAVQGAAGQDAR